MNKDDLTKKIKSLEPWYHPIDFGDGVIVNGNTSAFLEGRSKKQIKLSNNQRGLTKWNYYIAPNLPISLKGASILDIGSNSGLFSLHCLQQGAVYAKGVELEDKYINQARFLKEFYIQRDKHPYDFDIVQYDMSKTEKYLDRDFDLCLMLNVLRMIKDYKKSVEFLTKICSKCSNILVQGTRKNGKDDDTVLQAKLTEAGYKATIKVMDGTRGIIGIGTR